MEVKVCTAEAIPLSNYVLMYQQNKLVVSALGIWVLQRIIKTLQYTSETVRVYMTNNSVHAAFLASYL